VNDELKTKQKWQPKVGRERKKTCSLPGKGGAIQSDESLWNDTRDIYRIISAAKTIPVAAALLLVSHEK
jgi:hypothetical protein